MLYYDIIFSMPTLSETFSVSFSGYCKPAEVRKSSLWWVSTIMSRLS